MDYAGKRNTTALVIGRGGHIVFEKYWGDTTLETQLAASQFGRVLVPLLVGSAMNDRLIVSLDEPVSNYLPEYADTPAGKGTIRDHLGLRVEDSSPGSAGSPGAGPRESDQTTLRNALSERLWKPMGAGEFSVRRQGSIEVDARIGDWMRIGELLANEGVFEGNQFTPPRFVALMQKPTHNNSPLGLGVNVGGAFCRGCGVARRRISKALGGAVVAPGDPARGR